MYGFSNENQKYSLMKHLSFTLLFSFITFFTASAQLPNGTTAPDFTVTDLDGNVHNLYTYLNSGVSVVLEISATWCGPCWSYHNSGALSNFYNAYGPPGTGDIMVIFVEGDPSTSLECLYGPTGCTGGTTLGNWVAGTPFPIIHENGNAVATSYALAFYPTIYMISAGNNRVYRDGQPQNPTLVAWMLGSFKLDAIPTILPAVCGGDGGITLDVIAGFGNKNYIWSNGATTKDLINVNPGYYQCTITDQNNYNIVTDLFEVTGPVAPVFPNILSTTMPTCNGGTNGGAVAIGLFGNGGFTYGWSTGQTGANLTNVPAGTYTLTVTDAAGCTIDTEVVINQPSAITSEVSAPAVGCGQSVTTVTASALGGTGNYTYSIGTGFQPSGVFNDVSAGVYQLTVLDQQNCENVRSFTITQTVSPEAAAVALSNITCAVTTPTVSGSGSSSGSNVTYLWTTTNGTIQSGGNSIDAIVSSPGTYSLLVTNTADGCSATASTTVIQNLELPVVAIAAPGTVTCTNQEVTLAGSVDGDVNNFTISWTTTNGTIVSGDSTLTPVVSAGGDYLMSAVRNSNSCAADSSVNVSQLSVAPSVAFTYSQNGANVTTTGVPTGVYDSVLWDFDNGSTSTEVNASTIYTTAGVYNLCFTATNDCGANTTCQEVTFSTVLGATSTAIDSKCFGNDSGVITVNITGGLAPFAAAWTGPSGYTANTINITNLAPGTYNLILTDAVGGSVSQSSTISEPTAVTAAAPVIVNSSGSAPTGSITFSVSGGVAPYTYLWSNGARTQNIENVAAGDYSVVVTDGNNCAKSFGTYVVEKVSAVGENAFLNKFELYPNPTSHDLFLDIKFVNSKPSNVKIVNQLGISIRTMTYQGDVSDKLDVSALSAGMYFIEVSNSEFSFTRRFVIVK